jgi:ArsR family transcriptional regulator, virulence genes transcriptional regulator
MLNQKTATLRKTGRASARPAGANRRPATPSKPRATLRASSVADRGRAAAFAAQATEVAAKLNLMGNANRLLILCHLATRSEMKVGDLVRAVHLSQSALSQHLTKLRAGGLVTYRRQAQTLYYRISDVSVRRLIDTFLVSSSRQRNAR